MSLADEIKAAILALDEAAGTARLRFSGDELFFQGHFPDAPVLPAMTQIAAARLVAERVTGRDLQVVEVSRAVFTRPVGPGVELRLQVELDEPEPSVLRVKATLRTNEHEIAAFTLRCRPSKL
jgi:3-hydroxyacyl-[acyl-carrier-protein] dehydratase